ncbi:GyrI-like domain-containing protein [Phreatobacter sp.]|uniref:GyrI-like domain-containing protein n=1 Tax=Phreatobacter sp. TaxID=1966341 RepID=UPI003F6E5D97
MTAEFGGLVRSLTLAAGLGLAGGTALAQPAPAPAPAETVPPPAQQPAPAEPAPATPAPATPAPATPEATPPEASTPPAEPIPATVGRWPTDEEVQAAGFGEEVVLEPKPALVVSGKSSWDDIYATFYKAIADATAIARAQGVDVVGPPMIRLVTSSDTEVEFEALVPVSALTGPAERFAPAKPGTTPGGSALRFVHLGGHDTMEQTYDEITNHLDERGITAEDAFLEEYIRDPQKTPETDLATFIYVFRRR